MKISTQDLVNKLVHIMEEIKTKKFTKEELQQIEQKIVNPLEEIVTGLENTYKDKL